MENEKNSYTSYFDEKLFNDFMEELKSELNTYEDLSDEEIKQVLESIIKEYENEFYNNFSEIFFYNYYKNILCNAMDKILNFVQTKESLNNKGKDEVLKVTNAACSDVLYLFDFDFVNSHDSTQNKFISKITGKEIPINYQVAEIITNDDIFFRPPKGDPNLRGPHINYTIEYSLDYWLKFKENIQNYIDTFEKTHSEDFLEDLNDYRYWLNKYRGLTYFLSQKDILKNFEGGEKHVKN